MSAVTVPLTKKLVMRVSHGHLELTKVDPTAWKVCYHNPHYVNSPFELFTHFSTDFTVDEIVKSREVVNFVTRITGDIPE